MIGRLVIRRGLVLTAVVLALGAGAGTWVALAHSQSAEAALKQEGPLSRSQVDSLVSLAAAPPTPMVRGQVQERLMREDAATVKAALAEAWGGADEARADFARVVYCARWPEEGIARLAGDIRKADSDHKIRWMGIVGGIVGKPSADILLENLQDPDPAVRNSVCNILRSFDRNPDGTSITGRFHEYSPQFVEVLRGMRQTDPVPAVRTHSNCALQVLTDDRPPIRFREPTFNLDAK